MADEIRRLSSLLANKKKEVRVRQAKVEEVDGSELNIKVGNNTFRKVRYLDSYSPSTGDTVWCLQFGADILVLGKLAD